jgi:rhamnose transport system permease protein
VAEVLRGRSAGAIVFLVALAGLLQLLTHRFLAPSNIRTILFTAAVLAIAASAQGVVVITRNLDISIGAVMAMAAYVSVLLYVRMSWIGLAVLPIALAIGTVCGAANGLLVAYARIPAIVATLGTMSIYRGLIYASANGQEIDTDQLLGWMLRLGGTGVAGVPVIVVVAVVVVAAATLALRHTSFGRSVYAVGSNPRAAVYYGLPSQRLVCLTYALEGLLAGLAGFLLAAQVGTITIDVASGWELQTLAAVVIGGVSLLGGSGSLGGAAAGALTIGAIDNGLVLLGVHGYWQMFIQGAVIVVAIAFDLVRRTATEGSGWSRLRRRASRPA